MFKSCTGLYPYDVYRVDSSDLDKDISKGSSLTLAADLRQEFLSFGKRA